MSFRRLARRTLALASASEPAETGDNQLPLSFSMDVRKCLYLLAFRFARLSLVAFSVAGWSPRPPRNQARAANTRLRRRRRKIEVTILRDTNRKPIENAAVIFHTLKEKGNMELKSNEDGKRLIDVLKSARRSGCRSSPRATRRTARTTRSTRARWRSRSA